MLSKYEFLARNTGFQLALNRAEVRMGQNEVYAVASAAWSKPNGQDTLFVTGNWKRKDVRANN